jgi:hypothetical protein
MIFLIDYDRRSGSMREFCSFPDSERRRAERLRLEMEIKASPEAEIVLLEAKDEETVRKTHARYFETAAELLSTSAARG